MLLGGHWAVLQTVAWAAMVCDFAKTDAMPVALAKTFDGEHACAMCQAIAQRDQHAKQPAAPESTKAIKLDGICPSYGYQLPEAPMVALVESAMDVSDEGAMPPPDLRPPIVS